MSTGNTDKTFTITQTKDGWTETISTKLMSKIKSVRNLMLVFALFMEMNEFQHQQFARDCAKSLDTLLRGYEYDDRDNCVVERWETGEYKRCRPRATCEYYQEVDKIDVYDSMFMTKELFMERYANTGRPVVVRNAVNNWPAMEEFSFLFFKDLYKNANSSLWSTDNLEGCYFTSWSGEPPVSNLSEAFDIEESEVVGKKVDKPWYVGWSNECAPKPANIIRRYFSEPAFIEPQCVPSEHIFMGSPGHGTNFHIDSMVKFPSWQAQVKGVKKWTIRPPPECYRSCPSQLDVILHPGDVFVIDIRWWEHATSALEEGGLSIALTNLYIV